MKHQLIAGIVALGLALSGVATPVRAGSEDAAKVLTGVVALFALSQILRNSEPKATYRPAKPTYSNRNPGHHAKAPPPSASYGKAHGFGHHKGGKGAGWRAPALPGHCYYRSYNHGRMQGLYSRDCLARAMGGTRHLPQQCRQDHHSGRGAPAAFKANCLREHGYRVEARR